MVACVRFGLPGFLVLGCVYGEEHAGGAGVVGEVVGNGAGVTESAVAVGEVDSECCADAVGVQGAAHGPRKRAHGHSSADTIRCFERLIAGKCINASRET